MGYYSDYEETLRQQEKFGEYIGHRVFSISPEVFKLLLGKDIKAKHSKHPFVFKNPEEKIWWAVLRMIKRFFTGHRYVWHFLLRKLMVIYTKI